VKNDKVLIC